MDDYTSLKELLYELKTTHNKNPPIIEVESIKPKYRELIGKFYQFQEDLNQSSSLIQNSNKNIQFIYKTKAGKLMIKLFEIENFLNKH